MMKQSRGSKRSTSSRSFCVSSRWELTPQGRRLVTVILSKDGASFQPSKPVFLIQAGIHSGEIDGKDAMLMLVRDICFKGRDDLIDKVNIVFIPY
jgi:predicted deacylase